MHSAKQTCVSYKALKYLTRDSMVVEIVDETSMVLEMRLHVLAYIPDSHM